MSASVSGLFGVKAEVGAGGLLSTLGKAHEAGGFQGAQQVQVLCLQQLPRACSLLVLELLPNTVPWALWLPDTTCFGFLLLIVLSFIIEESTLGLAWTRT